LAVEDSRTRMLRDFISMNRDEILSRSRARAATRRTPTSAVAEGAPGLSAFLDQIGEALGKTGRHEAADHGKIHVSAGAHGELLFRQGLSVAQVVNTYGDLCQVISGLAVDQNASISARDFQTLNLCLDDATAGAVTAFASQRERAIAAEGTEQLGVLAHEMGNAVNAAVLAFGLIKKGTVAAGGSTGALVERSLTRLRRLVDRSLADVRLEAGLLNVERIPVAQLLEEAEIGGAIVARAMRLELVVATLDSAAVVEGDRPILAAAVANLLQNAFKFTRPGTTVKLVAKSTADRVLIEVEDECGGLPSGSTETLLAPFTQKGRDRTGLGLGLSICVKAMKGMAGELHIRDLPGKGCIFTLDLPKQAPDPTLPSPPQA
jgi:signal transduction histidine kinase